MNRRNGSEGGFGAIGRSPFGFLRNVFFPKKPTLAGSDDPVVTLRRKRRQLVASGLALALFVILFVGMPAMASNYVETLAKLVLGMLTSFILVLCEVLGFLILMLVDFLVNIAQYNNFVKAYPVAVGWPIMRDTVNMFFIIVVLVSAFSTIVGYKDFHYKSVLPKLLLMAVLINFSKTLIGLMIDFSQVITLTFVNGFKTVAGNNFIQALHLGDVMKVAQGGDQMVKQDGDNVTISWTGAADASVDTMSVVSILAAAIFALWVMSISLTLMVIMIIFFLARIIILWILLITSPVMFFALALPDKMKKGFSPFTSDWWKRLTSALVGGPVMAFFLWLSLALSQNFTQVQLYKPSETSELTQQNDVGKNVVMTKIGKPDALAHFIVMVAFMLMGVQTAVSLAREAAPQIGSVFSKVGEAGGMLGAGAVVGAMAYKGTAAGAGYLDRKTGATSWAAGKLVKSSMAGVLPQSARFALAKHAAQPKRLAAQQAEEYKKNLADMGPSERRKEYQRMFTGFAPKMFYDKAERTGAATNAVSDITSGTFEKQRRAELEKELTDKRKKEIKKAESDPVNGKDKANKILDQIKAEASMQTQKEKREILATALGHADKYGLTDLQDKIREATDKDPSSIADYDKRREAARKIATDPELLKGLQPAALSDLFTATNVMGGLGVFDASGNVNEAALQSDGYKKLTDNVKSKQYAKAILDLAKTDQGRARIAALNGATPPAGGFDSMNGVIEVAKGGDRYVVSGGGMAGSYRFDRRTASEDEVVEAAAGTNAAWAAGGSQRAAAVTAVQGIGSGQVHDKSGALQSRNLASVARRWDGDADANKNLANLQTVATSGFSSAAGIQAAQNLVREDKADMEALFGYTGQHGFASAADQSNAQNLAAASLGNIATKTNVEDNVRVVANMCRQVGSNAQGVTAMAQAFGGQNLATISGLLQGARGDDQRNIAMAVNSALSIANAAQQKPVAARTTEDNVAISLSEKLKFGVGEVPGKDTDERIRNVQRVLEKHA